MYANELKLFAFHHAFAHLLADPVPADRWAEQPAAGVNHPAWIIGHLAVSADFALKACGGQTVCPPEWRPLFSPGTTPKPDLGAYPTKAELLAAYDRVHADLTTAVPHADPAALTSPQPIDFLRPHIQTMGELLAHILSTHEAFHLGQFSTWRRVLGFPSARG